MPAIRAARRSSAALCRAVAADPNIDMLAWGSTLPSGKRSRDPTLLRGVLESTDKPVIAFVRMNFPVDQQAVQFQEEVGFPYLQGLPATVRALAALAFYGARRGRPIAPLPPAHGRAETLEGAALEAALASRGLPPPKSGRAASPAEAAEIAARIGFPVALKIASAEISHKTEVGGVRLHLGSAPEVEREAAALTAAVSRHRRRAARWIDRAGDGGGRGSHRRRPSRSAVRPDDGGGGGRHSGGARQGRGVPAAAGLRRKTRAP